MLKKVETNEGARRIENRTGILLSEMPERGVESQKIASRVPHGEALLMALFLQLKQTPANHPLPLIWGPLFERKS